MDDRDQEEILEKLTQRVQAEQATAAELRRQNDLAEQSLNNLERTRQAESQRIRIWLGIAEQTASLVNQLPEALLLLHGLDENLREVVRRLDRLENVVLLLLSGGNQRKANQLAESIERDRKARLIETNKRVLEQLELKRAAYGNLEAPAHLLIQIEDLQNEIRQLEEREG
jgi:hypothetical protein